MPKFAMVFRFYNKQYKNGPFYGSYVVPSGCSIEGRSKRVDGEESSKDLSLLIHHGSCQKFQFVSL